jgi:hypothetical protein
MKFLKGGYYPAWFIVMGYAIRKRTLMLLLF